MALFDHRVFRCGDNWWVAQVHSGSGAAWGDIPIKIESETAIFSCLTQTDLPSRSHHIPANRLNRLAHGSLCLILERARRWDSRFKMSPFNAPDAEEGGTELTDDEGLRWNIKVTNAVDSTSDVVPGLEFICLDDSALRFSVTLGDLEQVNRLLESPERLRRVIHGYAGTLMKWEPQQSPI